MSKSSIVPVLDDFKTNVTYHASQKILAKPLTLSQTKYVRYITDLSSLSKTNPLLAATAAVLFFSNAGIPPLAGFYGKLNIFLAAMENSVYFLAFSGVICSVIGAFYSIRLVKILYFHSVSQKH